MEGCLPNEENEAAILLQYDICGPREKIVGDPGRDGGERSDGARRHDHAVRSKRPARDRSVDPTDGMDYVRQPVNVVRFHVGLVREHEIGRPGHHEVGLDSQRPQRAKKLHPVDDSRGPCDSYDQTPWQDSVRIACSQEFITMRLHDTRPTDQRDIRFEEPQ